MLTSRILAATHWQILNFSRDKVAVFNRAHAMARTSQTKLLACAFLISLGPTIASAQGLNDLTAMAAVTGKCERLVMAGTDMSEHCNSKIIQSIYSTGRTGFTILVGDKGTAVTFSGMEGAKPDANSQLQTIDKVILNLNIEGVAPSITSATGSCSYGNPYLGPVTISCNATSGKDAFLLEFRTDGSEPRFTEMGKEPSPPKSAQASAEFQVGPWIGAPLKNDDDRGCLMSMRVNPKVTLMVYANGNEAFTISLHDDRWNFGPDDKIDADLLFDGSTYPLNEIEVRNPKVLTLHGGSEEEGVESFFRESSTLEFRRGREQIRAKLTKSSAAADALWKCAERG